MKFKKIIFLLILITAAFFRFWHLSGLPVSLNWDEISHGYNAYSLLLTGKDQWGVSWPKFNFRAYGDYPTVANLYLTIPFVKLLGLNALSTRLPSAISGLLFVVLSYFLGLLIFKNKYLSLLLMLLTAIMPWTLFPSRAVFQSTIAQTLFLAGIVFLLSAVKSKPKLYLFGFTSLALSMYAYHSTRFIAPLIFIAYIFVFFNQHQGFFNRHRLYLTLSIAIFFLICVPSIINLLQPQSQARSRWVAIINPASINVINENRRLFTGPSFLNHILNNKITYFIPRFTLNYLNLFNPLPLFINGTNQYQFNIPNTGLLFSVCLPFFYIGLLVFLSKIKSDLNYRFLLLWYLIAIIPAALTTGDYPAIRAATILPLPLILIVLGFSKILKFISIKKFQIIFSLVFLSTLSYQFIRYWQNYTTNYNTNYSWSWQYGYERSTEYVKSNYNNYNHIFFTKKYGEPHEFILFYWPWNPASYQHDPRLNWNFHADWYWVDNFDKFTFINDWQVKNSTQNLPPKSLLITSPGNYTGIRAKLLKTIYFLDGKPCFDIVAYD